MYIRTVVFFPIVLTGLLLCAAAGTALRRRLPELVTEDHRASFAAVQAAVLALLGLLLGFSFSMGVSRYDTRKNAEIAEANAIHTALLRTGSLAGDEGRAQRHWLKQYVQARTEFYDAGTDWTAVTAAATRAAGLQEEMVEAAEQGMDGQRDAVTNAYVSALTAMGDAAEQRQAAIENTIPKMAWVLLTGVAAIASLLVGFGIPGWHPLTVVLPVVISASLALVWDLDHPRSGLVRVRQDSMQRARAMVMRAADR